MTIRLISAILVREADWQDGKYHLVNPLPLIPLPVESRSGYVASGADAMTIPVPTIILFLCLWGGVDSERYTVKAGFVPPGKGPSSPARAEEEFIWDGHRPFSYTKVNLKGEVAFTESGFYTIEVDLNGKRVSEIPLAIFWKDEPPPSYTDIVMGN